MTKRTIKLSLVNKTGDGVIKIQTTNQKVVDFLLELGYHAATPEECRRALRKAREADKRAAIAI